MCSPIGIASGSSEQPAPAAADSARAPSSATPRIGAIDAGAFGQSSRPGYQAALLLRARFLHAGSDRYTVSQSGACQHPRHGTRYLGTCSCALSNVTPLTRQANSGARRLLNITEILEASGSITCHWLKHSKRRGVSPVSLDKPFTPPLQCHSEGCEQEESPPGSARDGGPSTASLPRVRCGECCLGACVANRSGLE
jgi:hypothetical protein